MLSGMRAWQRACLLPLLAGLLHRLLASRREQAGSPAQDTSAQRRSESDEVSSSEKRGARQGHRRKHPSAVLLLEVPVGPSTRSPSRSLASGRAPLPPWPERGFEGALTAEVGQQGSSNPREEGKVAE